MKRRIAIVLLLIMGRCAFAQTQMVGTYSFLSATDTFVSIVGTGQHLTALDCDDGAVLLPLPFSFPFGLRVFDSIYVTSNGQVGLGNNPCGNGYFATHATDMDILSPLGLDLNLLPGVGMGHVYWQYLDTAETPCYVVEFYHVRPYSSPSSNYYNFQVRLYPNGDIHFVYGTCLTTSSGANAHVFVRDNQENSAIFLEGTWDSVWVSGSTAAQVTLNSASHPLPNQCFIFQRPIITCPATDPLYVHDIHSYNATVSWHENGTASQWVAEYADSLFVPGRGQGTVQVVQDTTAVLTGLLPQRTYHLFVHADCGGGDTSLNRYACFNTPCQEIDTATLPYFFGFEDAQGCGPSYATAPCWDRYYYDGNTTWHNNMIPCPFDQGASGHYSLRFYADGATEKSWAVLPSFEGAIQYLTLSFKVKRRYHWFTYNAHVQVGIIERAEDFSTFVPFFHYDATSATSWDDCEVPFYNYTGPNGRIAIVCQSEVTDHNQFCIDDILVTQNSGCGYVSHLSVAQHSGSTAILVWDSMPPESCTSYDIAYRPANDTAALWNQLSSTDNFCYIGGLTPGTTYLARVRPVCSPTYSGAWRYANFVTDPCPNTQVQQVGFGNAPSDRVPFPYGGSYTITRQLYTADELQHAGPIFKMAFEIDEAVDTRTMDIYLAHTTDTICIWRSLDSSAVLVYSGDICFTPYSWMELSFQVPFYYNGTDNLMLVTHERTTNGAYHPIKFKAHHILNRVRSDSPGPAYTPFNCGILTSYIVSERNNVRFYFCDSTGCASPIAMVDSVGVHHARLIWAPGGNETLWRLYMKRECDTVWRYVTQTPLTQYTFGGLLQGAIYNFRVDAVCGADTASGYAVVQMPCSPIDTLPFTEDFDHWGTSLPNCWSHTYPSIISGYPTIRLNDSEFSMYNRNGDFGGSLALGMVHNGGHYCTVMPPIDTAKLNIRDLCLSLYLRAYVYERPCKLVVQVARDPYDTSSYTPIDTLMADDSRWHFRDVLFNQYTGTGRYIIFTMLQGFDYPLIDDLVLDIAPNCVAPNHLIAYNPRPDTVTLAWNERTAATQWQVEYGPVGFVPGTGTRILTSSNPFTITLPSGFRGEYYVRSICAPGDTSAPSGDPCILYCLQEPAPVPYTYGFEEDDEWALWSTLSQNGTDWCRGSALAAGGSLSAYLTADSGATPSMYTGLGTCSALYRDIDFGPRDTSFVITCSMRADRLCYEPCMYLVAYLVDPTIDVVAPSEEEPFSSPWGLPDTLPYLAFTADDTAWNTFTINLDAMSGVRRLAFCWLDFTYSTSDPQHFRSLAVGVDDIDIRYAECPRPYGLRTDSIAESYVRIAWEGPDSTAYQVHLRPNIPGAAELVANTTSPWAEFSGLASNTRYEVWAIRQCSTASNPSSLFYFNTLICDNAVQVSLQDTTLAQTATDKVPFTSYNPYSYSQVLVDSAELAQLGDGVIHAISFESDRAQHYIDSTYIRIYLANSPDTSFLNGMVHIDSTNKVYSGNGRFRQGENLFQFDSLFAWDGHSSVLVAIQFYNYNSYDYSAMISATRDYKYRSIYYGGTMEPTQPLYPTVNCFRSDYRPNYILYSCGGACVAPIFISTTATSETLRLAWSGNASAYELSMRRNGTETWTFDTLLASNSFTIAGLQPSTPYDIRVRKYCDYEGMYSPWGYITLSTDNPPCNAPEGLRAIGTTPNTVTLQWDADTLQTQWQVHLFRTDNDLVFNTTDNPATLGSLYPDLLYSASVRVLCGDEYSPWSDTIQFYTRYCQEPEQVAVTPIDDHSAEVSWLGTGNQWQINYGPLDFPVGEGTLVNTQHTPDTLTQLLAGTWYDLYVRVLCEGIQYSNWSQKVTFQTTGQSIPSTGQLPAKIYPNPSSGKVTVLLPEGNDWQLELLDPLGRTLASQHLYQPQAHLDGLPSGTYFIRLQTSQATSVFRLVVK